MYGHSQINKPGERTTEADAPQGLPGLRKALLFARSLHGGFGGLCPYRVDLGFHHRIHAHWHGSVGPRSRGNSSSAVILIDGVGASEAPI